MVVSCIHQQLLKPTTTSFSVACSFTDTSSSSSHSHSSLSHINGRLRSHLVTARDDRISVWEVRGGGQRDGNSRQQQRREGKEEEEREDGEQAQLFHLRTHSLFGCITGLERVRTIASSEDSRDRLLISFKDAKLSLMEWNDSLSDLITVSIHTYERAPQLSLGLPLNFKPILSMDPNHRCATLLLPNSSLAVLPFFQSTSDLDLYDDDYLKGTTSTNDNLSSHLPYSPSFVLSLTSISSKIVSNNVRDAIFLPGFQKPTLGVLCQESLTWTSSLIDKVDTCSIYMITLDLDLGSSKVGGGHHPILMERKNLPYDSLYLKACPKSIGGVLLITPSCIIHVDQESNIKGLAVNSWLEHTSKLKLPHWNPPQSNQLQERTISTERDGTIDLQNSTLIFPTDGINEGSASTSKGKKKAIQNTAETEEINLKPHPSIALLFLADGSAYTVQLKTEGRFLSGLNLSKLTAMEPPLLPSSTISILPLDEPNSENGEQQDTYIYCGSLVGNGTLLRVEGDHSSGLEEATNGVASSELLHPTIKAEEGIDLDDDMDLYGDASVPSGLAGGGDDLTSAAHPLMSAAFTSPQSYRLVKCDSLPGLGSIRDLSLTLLREENELGNEEATSVTVAATGTGSGGGITYLEPRIASRSKRNLEVEASSGLWELGSIENDSVRMLASGSEHSSLFTLNSKGDISGVKALDGLTLSVSPSFSNGSFVRASSHSLELLDREGKVLSTFSPSDQIKSAAFSCSFGSCILNDGSAILVELYSEELKALNPTSLASSNPCLSSSIFEDRYFQLELNSKTVETPKISKDEAMEPATTNVVDLMDQEEEQVDYGDGEPQSEDIKMNGVREDNFTVSKHSSGPISLKYLILTRVDSTLEIYSLPDLNLLWSCSTLKFSPSQLESGESQEGDERIPSIKIADAIFSSIGGHPHLTVLFDNDLLTVYEANSFSETASSLLSLTFNKVFSHQLSTSSRVPSPPNGSDAEQPRSRLSAFESFGFSEKETGASNGIAVLGSNPGWIFKPRKGGVTFVESREDGFESFSPLTLRWNDFSGESRQKFVFSQDSKTFFASLPAHNYDLGLPTRSVRVGRTQTKILGHLATGTVVTSALYDTPWALFDAEEMTAIKDPSAEPAPTFSQTGCLELFADGTSEPVHGYEFERNEIVTCLEILSLKTQSTVSGKKDYIAAGTIIVNGEDRPSRGSTYIFDVVEIVAPPDDPTCRFALKLVCKEESKAPITALADINGYILTVIGQKLFVRSLESDDWMVTVAFIDVPYQISCLRRLKNFLLLGDVKKSVWFVAFQEEPCRLILLGKDHNEMECTSVNFLVHENEVGFLSSGADEVLRLLEYGPTVPTSQSGQKLLLRTEFQSTSNVVSSLVVPGKPVSEGGPSLTSEVVLSMTNGSLEAVVPIDELVFKRLQLLQGSLVRSAQHTGGLNPRAFRTVRNETVPRSLTKGILDASLLTAFESMSRPQMVELSRTLPGCDGPDQILRELAEMRSSWKSV